MSTHDAVSVALLCWCTSACSRTPRGGLRAEQGRARCDCFGLSPGPAAVAKGGVAGWGPQGLLEGAALKPRVTGKTVGGRYTGRDPEDAAAEPAGASA